MQNTLNEGDIMDQINLKLLGIYYLVQKSLKNNIATPMARDVKPIISFFKGDYPKLTDKVITHIDASPDPEKMSVSFSNLFNKIEVGQLDTKKVLGASFTIDETIEQMLIHDSFMALYDSFFRQFEKESGDSGESKKLQESFNKALLEDIQGLNFNKSEMWMFKEMLTSQDQRSPITITADDLCEVVDAMYEVSTMQHGPVITDKMLSDAVKESSILVPDYSPENFL